jgi:hypothetical protein
MRQWIAFRFIFLRAVSSGTKKFLAFHWSTSNSSVSSVLSVVLRLSNQKYFTTELTENHREKKRTQTHTSFLGVLGALCGYVPSKSKAFFTTEDTEFTEIKQKGNQSRSFLGVLCALCGCTPFKSKTFYHREKTNPSSTPFLGILGGKASLTVPFTRTPRPGQNMFRFDPFPKALVPPRPGAR